MQWDAPSYIIQAIIDFNQNSKHNINNISKQLNSLNCKHLQLRFYDIPQKGYLNKMLSFFDSSTLQSIDIIIPFSSKYSYEFFTKLTVIFQRINSIIITNSPKDELKGIYGKNANATINYIKKEIKDESACGVVDISYFVINLKMFTESQKHNTCLNRKISIDVNGDIKNCPSMAKSYGNIKNTTLTKAIKKQGFKDLWYIHKDLIEVCKDCEFRHICTDCRAYLKKPENIYSQPKKCNYNPYIAKWKGQEGYFTVKEWEKNQTKSKINNY